MDTCKRMWSKNELSSIVSGGKIYRHNIHITGTSVPYDKVDVYITVTSSSNLNVDSLTDLKTLLGDTFSYPATGYDNYDLAYIYKINQDNVFGTNNEGSIRTVSFTKLTSFTDDIKEA